MTSRFVPCHRLSHQAYFSALCDEVERFLAVVVEAPLERPVPTCPGWTVLDLARHVGIVHRWARAMVATLSLTRLEKVDDSPSPPTSSSLVDWLRSGSATLAEELIAADPDRAMWSWGADRHVRFWSRRMVHETTIHRADAEYVLQSAPSVDASIAVDGVDEFLENLPCSTYRAPSVAELRGTGQSIALRCPEAYWSIRLRSDGFDWAHKDAGGDVHVEGAAQDLYLMMWGRRPALGTLAVTGDQRLLEFWLDKSRT